MSTTISAVETLASAPLPQYTNQHPFSKVPSFVVIIPLHLRLSRPEHGGGDMGRWGCRGEHLGASLALPLVFAAQVLAHFLGLPCHGTLLPRQILEKCWVPGSTLRTVGFGEHQVRLHVSE